MQLGTLDQRGAAVLAGGQLFLADGFLDAGMTAPRYLGRLRGRIREGVNRFGVSVTSAGSLAGPRQSVDG